MTSELGAEAPLTAWTGLRVLGPAVDGTRSRVFRGELRGRAVAIRRSRRSPASLEWELDLMRVLPEHSFTVPEPHPADDGRLHVDGWCVQSWIEGRPPTTSSDWDAVARELWRLHFLLRDHPQRPGCVAVTQLGHRQVSGDADLAATPPHVVERCLVRFETYLESQLSVVHGDPGPDNIRVLDDGSVAFLDWDEARRDVPDLDFADLGVAVLPGFRRTRAVAAAHAWEALNGWQIEPDYAVGRFARLGDAELVATRPVLTDGTITLRPRTPDDVAASVAGEDDQIVTWLTGGVATPARHREHIDHTDRVWAVGGVRREFGVYVTTDGGSSTLIGTAGLNYADLDLGLDEVNVSYAIYPDWRRRGHATRALALIVDYALELEPNAAPTLKIDPRNAASAGVAAAAGFRRVRSMRRGDVEYEIHRSDG